MAETIQHRDRKQEFVDELNRRVLVLDGAMGTMIQRLNLAEEDFRGDMFTSSLTPNLKGCNDVLCLTAPDKISSIHMMYLEAGADIIETNTFNSNDISMSDYGLISKVEDLNRAGARLAVKAVAEYKKATGDNRRIFVAGSMGPTNVSLSIPGAGNNPGWDDMEKIAFRQAKALIEGGVDIILLETIFDTLNAKAMIHGIKRAMKELGTELPLMLSATLTETGRTLSGQSPGAFLASVANSDAVSVGFNCGFGAEGMADPLEWLSENADYYVSAYPNAGLPDEMGRYSETPEKMAEGVRILLDRKLVNIIGGCCGTTPQHISEIARMASEAVPRRLPEKRNRFVVSSINEFDLDAFPGFIKVGERCNVAGSRKFLRLVGEGNLSEALDIAAGQIEKGAGILDINMDDGMLDAPKEMENFVRLLSMDTRTAVAPLMIDSSDMEVVRRALKCLQGRPIVNSISLKNGEDDFISRAREIRELGGAVVVMAFDEEGQAVTYDRRCEILERACRLLVEKVGFGLHEITVDPNILAVATGLPEHDGYAMDFLKTISWIKENLPGVKVSGGVSNLSFAFRGNEPVRKAMHAIFLEKGIALGLDMSIVNPTIKTTSEWVEPKLKETIVRLFDTGSHDAAEQLLELAAEIKASMPAPAAKKAAVTKTDDRTPCGKLADMVVTGKEDSLEEILKAALEERGNAMDVIKDGLMGGMTRVGDMFAAGEMFLPQVVRSAGIMKKAVEWLTPHINLGEADDTNTADSSNTANPANSAAGPLMVLATVKGDVHDIGKNIVSIVMRCSGFRVIDLGVMVPARTIVNTAIRENADIIGLSGLITPSLQEMAEVVKMLESEGCHIPVFVGGATTSDLHTAVKIAPCYSGSVIHTADAASLSIMASKVVDSSERESVLSDISGKQEELRAGYEMKLRMVDFGKASELADCVEEPAKEPIKTGVFDFDIPVSELKDLFNKRAFLAAWGMHPGSDKEVESERLLKDAESVIDSLSGNLKSDNLSEDSKTESLPKDLKARIVLVSARRDGNSIVVLNSVTGKELMIPMLRSQVPNPVDGKCRSLADYLCNDDHIALFAVTTAGSEIEDMISAAKEKDEYRWLMLQTVSHRLVEAATEYAHRKLRKELWGIGENVGIRPAVGYGSMPDQSLVFEFDKILDYSDMGIQVTENGALSPSATTTGLMFGTEKSRFFDVGPISADQLRDYAVRRGMSEDAIRKFITNVV